MLWMQHEKYIHWVVMSDTIHFLSVGIVLGLAAGISPGPMLALVISETLRHNRAEGMKIAFAPLLTDTPIVILTLLVISRLSNADMVLGIIAILGGLFVSYLAYESIKTRGLEVEVQTQKSQSIRKAIMANMFNPHPYVFWLTIGATTILNASQKSITAVVVFIAAFYVMLVGSKVAVAVLVDRSRDMLRNKAYIWVMRILGLALLVFAFIFIKDGLQYFGLIQ